MYDSNIGNVHEQPCNSLHVWDDTRIAGKTDTSGNVTLVFCSDGAAPGIAYTGDDCEDENGGQD